MSENDNAGVEEAAQEAPLETEVEVSDSGASAESKEGEPDWKALYEKAEALYVKTEDEKENYKQALTQKRQLINKPEVEEVDDDAPLTRKELRRVLQEEVVPVVAENKVETALSSLVTNPEKRKLVKFYYENRIRQTGTSDNAIRQDIEAALAIADGAHLKKVNAELTRKTNMQKQPPLSGSASDIASVAKNHKFSSEQVAQLTARAKANGQDPTKFIEQVWKNQNKG